MVTLIGFTSVPHFPAVPFMSNTFSIRDLFQLSQQCTYHWSKVRQDTDSQTGRHWQATTLSAERQASNQADRMCLCCPTDSLPPWHPEPDPPGHPHYTPVILLLSSFLDKVLPKRSCGCSLLKQPFPTGCRKETAWLGSACIACSLWLYLLQHHGILNKEAYCYPLLPSGGERQECRSE